jgi:hypothetical protein
VLDVHHLIWWQLPPDHAPWIPNDDDFLAPSELFYDLRERFKNWDIRTTFTKRLSTRSWAAILSFCGEIQTWQEPVQGIRDLR